MDEFKDNPKTQPHDMKKIMSEDTGIIDLSEILIEEMDLIEVPKEKKESTIVDINLSKMVLSAEDGKTGKNDSTDAIKNPLTNMSDNDINKTPIQQKISSGFQKDLAKNEQNKRDDISLIFRPESLDDLGISRDIVMDGIVRHLYYSGNLTGLEISQKLKVPFNNIVENLLDQLLKQKYVSYEGGRGFGRSSMSFVLTDAGRSFAKDSLGKNQYMGPMPVSLEQYKAVFSKMRKVLPMSLTKVKSLLNDLVLPHDFYSSLGPAINSNHSIFIYGPPGNGKSVISDRVGSNLEGDITIPYAIEVDGQMIKLFDPIFHKVIEANQLDSRWVTIKRPYVFVGGELTYNMLNLNIDPVSKVYEAPLQLKANGGIFLIDDFGRQKEPPHLFLNRWIVPLENSFDVLNFSSGKSFMVPFEQLIIFSTNLNPDDLVDEAFLRRIRYKLKIGNPSPEIFLEIFKKTCAHYKLPYVLSEIESFFFYNQNKIPKVRSVLPRDLSRIIISVCEFEGIKKEVNFYTLKKASDIGFIQDDEN
ncbi:ATP-binding protein [bacterium]|nr:ATP-binding protein [bacterium]